MTKIRQRDMTYAVASEKVFFMSSSGHCSLDCSYCIVQPIVKHQPNLDFDDIAYLVEKVGGKAALLFSGSGDFFAGYHKKDRLLERVLDLDVEVALDVNGVMIHEFADLPEGKLAKIKYLNLTLHYAAVKEKNALEAWRRNALTLLGRYHHGHRLVGFIATPPQRDLWNEALDFYRRAVFAETGQPLVLIRDIGGVGEEDGARLDALAEANADMIEEVHQEDFFAKFAAYPHVLCPAGSDYFHVWHHGQVDGCGFVEERKDCGNVKERRFQPKEGFFTCTTPRYCDCSAVALTGKMRYPDTPAR